MASHFFGRIANATQRGIDRVFTHGALAGQGLELCYVESLATALHVHIEGSATIALDDGSEVNLTKLPDEVGGVTGHVRALNIRYVRIETADGRELLIPNDMLISTQVTNWTYSNSLGRIEFRLPLPLGVNVEAACALVMRCIETHPKALKTPAPYCVLAEFGEYALFFRVGFWVADVNEGRMHPQDEVMQAILRAPWGCLLANSSSPPTRTIFSPAVWPPVNIQ